MAEKTSVIFLLEHGPVFWSRVLCACRFVFRFGSLDMIRLHWGSLTSISRGDTLINTVALQLHVFRVGTLTFDANTIPSPYYDIR